MTFITVNRASTGTERLRKALVSRIREGNEIGLIADEARYTDALVTCNRAGCLQRCQER